MCWYNCIIEKSSDSEKKQSIFSYPTTQFHGESQTIHSETISSKEYLSSQKSILQKNYKTILHRAKQRHLESIRTLSCGSTKWINLFASRHEVHGTNQWWSLETHFCEYWSRWFQVSSRCRRLQVSQLWILQRKVFLNFCNSTIFWLVYLQVGNQNMSEKCQKFEKNEVRSDDDIFFNSAKRTNFEASSLGLDLQVSSLRLGLGIFDEVSVSVSRF